VSADRQRGIPTCPIPSDQSQKTAWQIHHLQNHTITSDYSQKTAWQIYHRTANPLPVTIHRRQLGRYIIAPPNSANHQSGQPCVHEQHSGHPPVGTTKCPSNSKTSHNQPVGTTKCPSNSKTSNIHQLGQPCVHQSGTVVCVCVCVCDRTRKVGFLPKART